MSAVVSSTSIFSRRLYLATRSLRAVPGLDLAGAEGDGQVGDGAVLVSPAVAETTPSSRLLRDFDAWIVSDSVPI